MKQKFEEVLVTVITCIAGIASGALVTLAFGLWGR
jgi:hypothetical protein